MYKIIEYDPWLKNYSNEIDKRMSSYRKKREELISDASLSEFSNGYLYYGLHREGDGSFVFREWAPGADRIHLIGDFNDWDPDSLPLTRIENDVFEIRLSEGFVKEGQKYKLLVEHEGQSFERLPSYGTYVVQDPTTYLWSCEVHFKSQDYIFHDSDFSMTEPPVIYECHIGMATEEYRVGTYREFTENVLPVIKKDGYNTIQIMAVMEHPYYASFGYQVSSFFAASSRFGTPEELKELIDTAHGMGIRVLLDVVHSHAIKNELEGLNRFDGTDYQYFHEGPRGDHPAWGTKLFNYGKNEVLHFLLSNLKFWMTEYHFDGFRFDGVTSMLYRDHGLGQSFDHYDKYFSDNTDEDAITYLMLANELVHELSKNALTIAEDMSGMPGMCLPISSGGIGFDYRLAMGTPDLFIKLIKEKADEEWNLWQIWYELTGQRPGEKVIGYAESHDQALVGDKTIMFRLADSEMYTGMSKLGEPNYRIDRAMALHKLVRLMVFTMSPSGYLNFMGNEFGHPEWIDFPREGNGWSYHYCRRLWSLVNDENLKYHELRDFDREMLRIGRESDIFGESAHNLWVHEKDQVTVYSRRDLVIALSLNPSTSFTAYFVPVVEAGQYEIALNSDSIEFGGYGRVDEKMIYSTEKLPDGRVGFLTYIPTRTGIVFRRIS